MSLRPSPPRPFQCPIFFGDVLAALAPFAASGVYEWRAAAAADGGENEAIALDSARVTINGFLADAEGASADIAALQPVVASFIDELGNTLA